MKNADPVPLQEQSDSNEITKQPAEQEKKREKDNKQDRKKKKQRNLWPLKAFIITLFCQRQ